MASDTNPQAIVDEPGKKITSPYAATQLVFDAVERGRTLNDAQRDKWKYEFNLYSMYVEEPRDLVQSNIMVPLAFSHIESYLPRMLANRPRIEVWERERADSKRAAQHRALQFYYWDRLQMILRILDLAKNGFIFGTAVFKTYHRKEVRRRRVRRRRVEPVKFFGVPIPGQQRLSIKSSTEKVPIYDDPVVEVVDLDRLYVDPDGHCPDTCYYMVHEIPGVDIHTIEAQAQGDEPLYDREVVQKLKTWAKGGNPRESLPTELEEAKLNFEGGVIEGADPHKRQVTLYEYWTDFRVITVVKEAPHLPPLRNEENPFDHGRKPFQVFKPIPVANKFHGISMVDVVAALQIESSSLKNLRLDHYKNTVNAMAQIRRGANVNIAALRSRPNGYYFVDDHDDIQYRETPKVDFTIHREEDSNRLWAQMGTGASDPFMGIASNLDAETATGASLMFNAAGSRAGLIFMVLSEMTLRPLARMFISLSDQFIDDERFVRIVGEDNAYPQIVRVDPFELRGSGADLDVMVDVAQTEPATRQFRLQQAINAISTIGQLLPPDHPLMELFYAQLAQGFGIENPEGIIARGREMIAMQRAAEATGEPENARQQALEGAPQPGSSGEELALEAAQAQGAAA